ncbi:MAG: gamma-glutamylcyclotransferase [Kofleriaceae bacterium]|nr:gamma-glutamylcyclotransferase [Kofleriaceae bacterium]
MKTYFAFGSNMSRARIQARTSEVLCLGAGRLDGFEHSFSYMGDDGSGKGNIVLQAGASTWGVLYDLNEDQATILHGYEVGYEIIQVSVQRLGEQVQAYAYLSAQAHMALIPTSEYIGHYLLGMQENEFPDNYVAAIRTQAGR